VKLTETGYPGSGLSLHHGTGVEPSNLGTGAVVKPSFLRAAKDWKSNLGRDPKPSDKPEWVEYARRILLMQDEVEAGWRVIMKEDVKSLRQVIQELHESLNVTQGYAIGSPNVMGLHHMDYPTLPFHTAEARKVWDVARVIARKHPDNHGDQIIRQAMQQANVQSSDLTPEDGRLLEIGVNWAQTYRRGPVDPEDSRTGGGPGAFYGQGGEGKMFRGGSSIP
jgi:hypothetical protein